MEERVLLQSNCSLYRVATKEELDSFSCGDYRPPVLRTATLYGCRTIKGLRHVVWDRTAWGKVVIVYSQVIR